MIELSVIIPTLGRPQLEQALAALAQQSLGVDRFEVCISVDGHRPAAAEMMARWRERIPHLIQVVGPGREGPAVVRNRAISATSAPLVAMTDDDCEPEPAWLESILNAFQADPELDGLYGCTETDRTRLTPFSHFVENRDGAGHQTCNCAYRRAALERLGGFDERFPYSLEDTDLYCRASASGRVRFEPRVRVLHPPRESTVRGLAGSARRFEGDFIFYAKHPELYRRRHDGRGPLLSVLYVVGLKHVLKQFWVQRSWLVRQPWTYARFVVAMLGFSAILWTSTPGWWRRHCRETSLTAAPRGAA